MKSIVLASGNPGKKSGDRAAARAVRHARDHAGRARHHRGRGALRDFLRERARQGAPRRFRHAPARARRRLGLCVDALGGAPGRSLGALRRRAAGRDARNNEKLLVELKDKDDRARPLRLRARAGARAGRHASRWSPQAEWHGEIARAPRGSERLRLRPAISAPGARQDRRGARRPSEKNRISHRGQALAEAARAAASSA